MGLFGSFGYGVASLVVVSTKEGRSRRRETTLALFPHSNSEKHEEELWTGTDSYFEIWVWNASILVRVLVRSSNTFSCSMQNNGETGRNDQRRKQTRLVQLVPTCTATPKLFPSSILGIWSCTHMDTCEEKNTKNQTV